MNILVVTLSLLSACAPLPAHSAAIVIDRSDSLSQEDLCNAVAGITELELASPELDSRSTIQVWVTGDGRNGGARQIVAPTEIPVARSALAGSASVQGKKAELLQTVVDACQHDVVSAGTSPIYDAVDNAARSITRGPGDDSTLWVVSDLQENVEPGLTMAIAGEVGVKDGARAKGRSRAPAPVQPVPTPVIDASGLTVHACGYGRTANGVISREDRDRTMAAWTPVLEGATTFVFDPACPSKS